MCSQDLDTVAKDIIQDALSEMGYDDGATPPDNMIEEYIDSYCKKHKWRTPLRYQLWNKIITMFGNRLNKDRTIDIRKCASEIFNNMDQINDVQLDEVHHSVLQCLDDEGYSRSHFNVLHGEVVKYIEKALDIRYYPPLKEDQDGSKSECSENEVG